MFLSQLKIVYEMEGLVSSKGGTSKAGNKQCFAIERVKMFQSFLPKCVSLDFLHLKLVPTITYIFLNEIHPDFSSETLWLQQEDAPPHSGFKVVEIFAGSWIGFLWGYLKDQFNQNKLTNIENLKNWIRVEPNDVYIKT